MSAENPGVFGAGFVFGILVTGGLAATFSFGYVVGNEKGKAAGEKDAAFIVVRSLHKVKDVPQNLFSDEDIKGLSYGAQNILKLYR